MQSKAATVAEYLASLPADRRATLTQVLDVVRQNLDPDYEEAMAYGMIGWCVPHRIFPAGYHCNPEQGLPFGGLASQKTYCSLYLMGIYDDGQDTESTWFRAAWAKTGKKLDMGKCCIRFKQVEDLALDVIAEAVRRMPVKKYVAFYEAARANQLAGKRPAARGKTAAKPKAKAKAKARPAATKRPAKATKAKAATRRR